MALRDVPLICFSHVRWDFVFQRPQQLMSRAARTRDVYFVEEPVHGVDAAPAVTTMRTAAGVTIVVPHLPAGLTTSATDALLGRMVEHLALGLATPPVLWYCTPAPFAWSGHLPARAIVYDCVDEPARLTGAPRAPAAREAELIATADVVFTRGPTLYRAQHARHPSAALHVMPSGVDVAHFGQARLRLREPADQARLPGPRAGYVGVIDERLDLALLDELAARRPELQLVMIGPVLRIDPATLPRRPNLHWLGARGYARLPSYLAGWDVALVPFAHGAATRFVAPTKIGEYLAAGRPVVASSIPDVVEIWGDPGLVAIADGAAATSSAIDRAIAGGGAPRRCDADLVLASRSWERTWAAMCGLVEHAIAPPATIDTGPIVAPAIAGA